MAWNPDPKIADIRDFAKKHGYDQVIVIAINNVKDTMESMTFGITKQLCDRTKPLGDVAYNAVWKKIEDGE